MPLSDEDMYALLSPSQPCGQEKHNFMGYTHYWYYQPTGSHQESAAFAQASQRIRAYKNFLEAQGTIICGPLGIGDAQIDSNKIRFNGCRHTGGSHESFSVQLGEKISENGFNFCKTARKSYDTLVCLSLLALHDELGPDIFHYASDGTDEDWSQAYTIFETFHNQIAPRLQAEPL